MAERADQLAFETLAVHAAETVELGGAQPTAIPIHNASSFYFEDAASLDRAFDEGYVYSRFANPTVDALERAVAELERAPAAVAFASGMAALHAAILSVAGGEEPLLLASRDCYGGTRALIEGPLAALGVRSVLVDLLDEAELNAALLLHPRAILLETISNPLLRVPDLPVVAGRARQVGASVIADSTFTTPYLCRPLEHGADLVVHSATKYLGGHGDVTAGLVAGRADLLAETRRVARLVGGVLGPNEAYLTLRGLRTLALRMERQCSNTLELAGWLSSQPRVERVYYPGLASHPQHEIAARLLSGGFGAVVSFDLRIDDAESAVRFIDGLRLFRPAPTLGDVGSLVMYPPRAAQRGLTREECRALGIGPGLIRLSVGIESAADLRADLARGLERL